MLITMNSIELGDLTYLPSRQLWVLKVSGLEAIKVAEEWTAGPTRLGAQEALRKSFQEYAIETGDPVGTITAETWVEKNVEELLRQVNMDWLEQSRA